MTHDAHEPILPDPPRPLRPTDPDATGWERIPPPLRNWQVVEIDGEAAVLEDAADEAAPLDASSASRDPIADRSDDIIALGLAPRHVELAPGGRAVFTVDLLNNGDTATRFDLSLEGWTPDAWWLADDGPAWPLRVTLQPGEQRSIECVLTLPATDAPPADAYPFAVVAHAEQVPLHRARCGATVVVEPQHAVAVGDLLPDRPAAGWWRRRATVQLPLSNLGNVPVTLTLRGVDRDDGVDFVFARPPAEDGDGIHRSRRNGRIRLAAGESRRVTVALVPRQRPILALSPWAIPFRVLVDAEDAALPRQAVPGKLMVQPLFGPWHLLAVALGAVVALVGLGLSGLALLLALRNAAVPEAPVAAPPAPAVALIIQLDQPAPPRVESAPASTVPVVTAADVAAPEVRPAAAPIVRADQITAPGEPTPADQPPLQPLLAPSDGDVPVITSPAQLAPPVAPPRAEAANMTYAQMFQEIGLAYDLDWRLLAAVAYVESGFDSLALSGQGDMGLMQIRPTTWREWAPTVAASDPFDSYSSVLVGARYLDYLRDLLGARGHTQIEWMLIAYNWGPEPVLTHLAAGGTLATLSAERRAYAEDVLRIAQSIPTQ